ncbi:MAG: PilZ domain-containing protein [Thermodesulfobacteriota bacterium]|nr:PilZ domain-containing protein [Thermodesulfobacteriota bacterium]
MKESTPQAEKASVQTRLTDLLKEISSYVDHASEEERQRILISLEELWERNRRQHPRKPCSIPVTCATEDRVIQDFVKNISAGGAFIETAVPFSPGEHITLMFSSTEQEEPIKISGRIVWRVPEGIGVKFTTASSELEAVILSL